VSLGSATTQMYSSMREAEAAIAALVTAAKSQESELAAMKARHEQLRALTAGQEGLARTYRDILRQQSMWDRARDVLGAGLRVDTATAGARCR